MASQGGNKGRSAGGGNPNRRSEDTAAQNSRDEAVSRDPDIGGVMRRQASTDPHKRDRPA